MYFSFRQSGASAVPISLDDSLYHAYPVTLMQRIFQSLRQTTRRHSRENRQILQNSGENISFVSLREFQWRADPLVHHTGHDDDEIEKIPAARVARVLSTPEKKIMQINVLGARIENTCSHMFTYVHISKVTETNGEDIRTVHFAEQIMKEVADFESLFA